MEDHFSGTKPISLDHRFMFNTLNVMQYMFHTY